MTSLGNLNFCVFAFSMVYCVVKVRIDIFDFLIFIYSCSVEYVFINIVVVNIIGLSLLNSPLDNYLPTYFTLYRVTTL